MSAIAPLRLPMAVPDDLGGFEALLDTGRVAAGDVVALWCKTRGNGLLNDFTKPWVDLLLRLGLARRLGCTEAELAERVPIMVSGGAEGAVSPHRVVWHRGRAGGHGLLAAVQRADPARVVAAIAKGDAPGGNLLRGLLHPKQATPALQSPHRGMIAPIIPSTPATAVR